MKQFTVVLLVDDHTVDNYEWLCIHVQRVQTLHEHYATHTGCTVTCDGIHLSTHLLLDLVLDVDGAGVFEISSFEIAAYVGLRAILCLESVRVEQHTALYRVLYQTHLYGVVVRRSNNNRRGEYGHFEHITTIVFCQHTIAFNFSCLDNGTGNRLFGSGIEHDTLHHACLIILLFHRNLAHRSNFYVIFFRVVFLCTYRQRESQE